VELARIYKGFSTEMRVAFLGGNSAGRAGWVQGGFDFEKYATRKGTESRREERSSEFVALRGVVPLSGTVSPERTEVARPRVRN
jgi:hypothetical protein